MIRQIVTKFPISPKSEETSCRPALSLAYKQLLSLGMLYGVWLKCCLQEAYLDVGT